MDLLATGINAAVVAAVGLLLWYLGRGRFEQVDKRFEEMERRVDRLEDTVNTRMDGFQRSLDGMRSEFRSSLDGMRSDLTKVALAVGARPEAGAGG